MKAVLSLRHRFRRCKYNKFLKLIVRWSISILVAYYFLSNKYLSRFQTSVIRSARERNISNLSQNVHIVDLNQIIKSEFQCIKTKKLLHNISTNVCLYEKKDDKYVSGSFRDSASIYEEAQVTRILQLLIRHPHLDFIDIGANIGTYTMYVAALGRFVLAIDCFAPNIIRLRRAIQLTNVFDQVVLVQNAVFTQSGQSLELSFEKGNIGGQSIIPRSTNRLNESDLTNRLSTNNPYIVKTITFDEVLPILIARGVRGALMKIDIEGSESFVVENGSRIFDTLDIPFVQMEWRMVRLNDNHAETILSFFDKHNYYPVSAVCSQLSSTEYKVWPSEIYWLKRNVTDFC